MGDGQRRTPVIRLLARLGWQRDPDQWTVQCRDERGEGAFLDIHLADTGITLAASSPGPWVLSPLDAGRLRGAVRDALLSFDCLAGGAHSAEQTTPRAVQPSSRRSVAVSGERQRVRLAPNVRPSMSIPEPLSPETPTTCREVSHGQGTDNHARRAGGVSRAA